MGSSQILQVLAYFLFNIKPLEKKNKNLWDFPGGLVVKNPTSNAGDAGLIPGLGMKIPHAMRNAHVPQLRPSAAK